MSNMKPSEFAKKIGVSVKTLQRWDNDGTLKAFRNPKGRRYYTEDQIGNYNTNNDSNSINCSDAYVEFDVIKIVNDEKSLYIEAGMTVNVVTDGTEFKDEYKNQDVLSVNESELLLEEVDIPWDYIRSITIVNQSKS